MTDQLSLFDTVPVKTDIEMPIPVTKPVIPDDNIAKSVTNAPINETPAQWALRKWEELAVVQWTKILAESIEQEDKDRAEYARKLLKQLEVK